MKDSLYIVMPAYNEKENIEGVVKQWYQILESKSEDSRMVIADSGSTDGTHELLMELQADYPKLVLLEDTLKQHGPKVIALYKYAIAKGADFVFQTDSDGQTNPDEFECFWQNRNEYVGQFGNRTVRGDGNVRAGVEKIVCMLLKLFFGVKIPDANAPFRLMNTKTIEKYIGLFDEDYNLPNVMLTTFFTFYNESNRFTEISFKPRTAGVNSINLVKIFKIGIKALSDFCIIKKKMKQFDKNRMV